MRALALIVLAACGGTPRPADRITPADDAPSCATVAVHLVELAERDNDAAATPELADGIRGEAASQCSRTPWSAPRRRCLADAASADATLACPAQ